MEPTIYKPGAYKSPGIYNGTGGIYKGRGVYNDGAGLFVEIGGRKYPVVKIGSQFWIAENLDYKWDGLNIGSDAWYYNNDEYNYGIDGKYKCGLLYTWFSAKYLYDNRAELLPYGWRVPSVTDLTDLAYACGGFNVAGTKLKSLDNSITSNWPIGWNGNNEYGFNALPVGWRYYLGGFRDFGGETDFWLNSEVDSTHGELFYLNNTASIFDSQNVGSEKMCGFSIRLVKDA